MATLSSSYYHPLFSFRHPSLCFPSCAPHPEDLPYIDVCRCDTAGCAMLSVQYCKLLSLSPFWLTFDPTPSPLLSLGVPIPRRLPLVGDQQPIPSQPVWPTFTHNSLTLQWWYTLVGGPIAPPSLPLPPRGRYNSRSLPPLGTRKFPLGCPARHRRDACCCRVASFRLCPVTDPPPC